jgi:acetyl esterase/lipase
MPISFQAHVWRFLLKLIFKNRAMTIEQNRAMAVQNDRFAPPVPKDIALKSLNVDGLNSMWIRPAGAVQSKVVLHLHGGGYVTGGIASHKMMCIVMAQTLKMNVLLPEYRLAPEHPFPAALEDALKVYRWLLAQGYESGDIIITGDSAGGGLALATVLSLRDAHAPLPAAVAVISPWADLTHRGSSHVTLAKAEAVLKTERLKEWALCYTDEANLINPLVSPVYADYRGFPPLLIQVGSEEVLLDDARAVADKAQAPGVDVSLRIWNGLWHVWPALGDLIPETRAAFEEMKTFLNDVISSVE